MSRRPPWTCCSPRTPGTRVRSPTASCPWLRAAAAGGTRVLVGDPGRKYLPPAAESLGSVETLGRVIPRPTRRQTLEDREVVDESRSSALEPAPVNATPEHTRSRGPGDRCRLRSPAPAAQQGRRRRAIVTTPATWNRAEPLAVEEERGDRRDAGELRRDHGGDRGAVAGPERVRRGAGDLGQADEHDERGGGPRQVQPAHQEQRDGHADDAGDAGRQDRPGDRQVASRSGSSRRG